MAKMKFRMYRNNLQFIVWEYINHFISLAIITSYFTYYESNLVINMVYSSNETKLKMPKYIKSFIC